MHSPWLEHTCELPDEWTRRATSPDGGPQVGRLRLSRDGPPETEPTSLAGTGPWRKGSKGEDSMPPCGEVASSGAPQGAVRTSGSCTAPRERPRRGGGGVPAPRGCLCASVTMGPHPRTGAIRPWSLDLSQLRAPSGVCVISWDASVTLSVWYHSLGTLRGGPGGVSLSGALFTPLQTPALAEPRTPELSVGLARDPPPAAAPPRTRPPGGHAPTFLCTPQASLVLRASWHLWWGHWTGTRFPRSPPRG